MPENVQPTRIPHTNREAIASQSLTLSYEKQIVIDALDITLPARKFRCWWAVTAAVRARY